MEKKKALSGAMEHCLLSLPLPPEAPIATVSPCVNNLASIIVLCISSSKA